MRPLFDALSVRTGAFFKPFPWNGFNKKPPDPVRVVVGGSVPAQLQKLWYCFGVCESAVAVVGVVHHDCFCFLATTSLREIRHDEDHALGGVCAGDGTQQINKNLGAVRQIETKNFFSVEKQCLQQINFGWTLHDLVGDEGEFRCVGSHTALL